ncbi:hypothetical protein Syun_026438 [Stephania yunnanensis]|uniref:Uncharacterized protein n=1 Tax=Stephania yunnanensis TaxID=152371 RepID=A0AAP0EZ30_9MAGN
MHIHTQSRETDRKKRKKMRGGGGEEGTSGRRGDVTVEVSLSGIRLWVPVVGGGVAESGVRPWRSNPLDEPC